MALKFLVPCYGYFIYKQIYPLNQSAFLLGYWELYVMNIYNWIFIIRKSLVSQIITISLSVIVYTIHYLNYYNDDFVETTNLIFSFWLLSCFLMNDWQKQQNEYLNKKIILSQNEFNLNLILEQFSSGIAFYNMTKGYFYNNKIFNYKRKILANKVKVLERKDSINRSDYHEKMSEFKRLSSNKRIKHPVKTCSKS